MPTPTTEEEDGDQQLHSTLPHSPGLLCTRFTLILFIFSPFLGIHVDWVNKGFIYAYIAWLAEEGGLLETTFKVLVQAISVGSNNLNFFF